LFELIRYSDLVMIKKKRKRNLIKMHSMYQSHYLIGLELIFKIECDYKFNLLFFLFVQIITHIKQVKEIFLFFPYGYLLCDEDTLIILMIKILFLYVRRK
jgi:hypothetical protein